jgi:hypothetical protein
MAVVITTYVGAGPQAGVQTVQCSAPATLAAVAGAIVSGTGYGFLQATLMPDINGNAPTKYFNVALIHSIEAFQPGGVADVPPSGP